ncbi:unnamed protein product [Ilex paraguariensis]|uniref:SBP-type domain-containing protein n=1 Tax=Ilex paraguariensis TaxID=185542 RepID=A0ABC8RRI0_9AQUA
MEARIGGEAQLFYGLGAADMRAMGKRSLEWDPNDWKWDGDLFIASSLNSNPSNYPSRQFFPTETGIPMAGASSNSSSSFSDEVNLEIEKEKMELEKRRRVIVVEDDNLEDGSASLTLKLGGHAYSMTERGVGNWEGTSGKKTKLVGATSNRAVCQVEDCGADLSKAKDYHRRHKVCQIHSKAGRALVGNIMQRFCQQCSRFHALQEFDEGKRSCRRRLAGHNKRRRKAQPDNVVNSNSFNDNQASGSLLISLQRILSNMHFLPYVMMTLDISLAPISNKVDNQETVEYLQDGVVEGNYMIGRAVATREVNVSCCVLKVNRTNHTDDQDMLSHLLRSLASQGALHGDKAISGLLQEPHNMPNNGHSHGNLEMVAALLSNGSQGSPRLNQQHCSIPVSEIPQKEMHVNGARVEDIQTTSSQRSSIPAASAEARDSSAGRSKLNNFDLNDVYIDSDDGIEDIERSPVPVGLVTGSLECPSWVQQDSHQSSPPQTSGNSDSTSTQSPSSSSGDAQSRTERIVVKLFGKEPSEFPYVLRAQILDWLSHSPTDIESYIRPGCIILTIYLRLSETVWEELCCDLGASLSRLLDASDEDTFWRTGWVSVRVQNQIAYMCNGQVVVDTSLPLESYNCSEILSVKPIAIPVSERAQILVKGFNLSRSSNRLLCALEGNYLVQEANNELEEDSDSLKEHGELQCVSFSCNIPAVTGRGFIEIEDHGLGGSFFPFIVAERDVCSEIRMLESEIEVTEGDDIPGVAGKVEARDRAMDFVHEMGWLLHRNGLKSRLGHLDPNSDLFPFKRFKWLIEFSMDHDWCAVVKNLLDILLDGTVGSGEQPFLKSALFEMGLLHRAVRRNSRSLVELLLRYVPEKIADELRMEHILLVGGDESFLFRPDAVGPAGLTPLHVAAGRDGSEEVLDALTDDHGKVGVEAWKNARDSTGCTPEDYARLRGHYSYIHLVQKKMKKKAVSEHVVLDIPGTLSEWKVKQKQEEGTTSFEIGGSGVRPIQRACRLCDQKVVRRNASRSLLYRPAMLSMVAIAAVCVCVALLFKSSPEVLYMFRPFRWELLGYGSS